MTRHFVGPTRRQCSIHDAVHLEIRHGESTDNLRSVWAGWKDAPLSNHGMNQARALGTSLSNIPFTAIHASDLLRAHSTALALHAAQPVPQPPLTTSPLLREQHFGIAEGQPWTLSGEPDIANGVFPVLYGRDAKWPEGESLNDLTSRADKAIRELILPHLLVGGEKETEVAVVSHGLCISELVAVLLRMDWEGGKGGDYRGLMNTAWTRVTVGVKEGAQVKKGDKTLPPLVVRVTDVNRHEHITNIKRQKGGIGSAAHDPKQADIRAFFGGGAAGAVNGTTEAMEHSESNARDEVGVEIEPAGSK